MNFQDYMFVLVVVFGISLTTVSCLKCHVCSTINAGEEDCTAIPEGHTKFLQNCTAPHDKSCRIQEQWVEFEVLNQTTAKRTIRQCASTPFDSGRPCYYRAGFGGKVNVCNCQDDGCNEASITVSTVLLTIILLLLVRWIS